MIYHSCEFFKGEYGIFIFDFRPRNSHYRALLFFAQKKKAPRKTPREQKARARQLPHLRLASFERPKHLQQSLPPDERSRPALRHFRLPALPSALRAWSQASLSRLRKIRPRRRPLGRAPLQQDAGKKARDDCRLLFLPKERSQMKR